MADHDAIAREGRVLCALRELCRQAEESLRFGGGFARDSALESQHASVAASSVACRNNSTCSASLRGAPRTFETAGFGPGALR